jgi:hypothetical protein
MDYDTHTALVNEYRRAVHRCSMQDAGKIHVQLKATTTELLKCEIQSSQHQTGSRSRTGTPPGHITKSCREKLVCD